MGNVYEIGLFILKINYSISLVNDEYFINLWFVLVVVDNNSYLVVIKELMELLIDELVVIVMLNVISEVDILEVIVYE